MSAKSKKKHDTVTRSERKEWGKALRRQTPLSSHGNWSPAVNRPDPIDILQQQDEGRIQGLLPIKYGRMMVSPFAFLRGSAVVMSADLADTPTTALDAVICGDAHLSNFGVYASPERRMVFDLNDFDEAYYGPWEWDLKRLATSAVVAGRDNGFSEKKCRKLGFYVAKSYAKAMDFFAKMPTLEQWYYYTEAKKLLTLFEKSSKKGQKGAANMIKKGQAHTHEQTLDKLITVKTGQSRIISKPPLLVPLRELELDKILGTADSKAFTWQAVEDEWAKYLESLPRERSFFLQRYAVIDAALRVGGIGSVGTHCFVLLLEGEIEGDNLILQLKEASKSVLEPYVTTDINYENSAQRVVIGQQLMQTTNDVFLGWGRSQFSGRDYYWRQLKDMKGSADVPTLDEEGLETYVNVCSWCLARAHARTGYRIGISGYLGRKDTFADAIADFSVAYADQTEKDHEKLLKAVKAGRIAVETGI